MKPLVLTLQAFGTFKDKVIIDFREFENAGLFLITGPTGSGKTTIFDGLMYALYGMMSGDDRDSTKSVKSQFASDEVECYVELQFVAKQSEYTIRRSPEQRTLGKSKRIIDQKSQVSLKTPDERLTKINEVNNKITEILNLTATQFKQIVLLPQGEFKKLLFASSIEKEAILRSVFNTQEIQKFSELLKKKSVDISKEVNSTQTKILTLFQSIDNPSEVLQQAIALQDLCEVIDLLKQSVQHHQQRLTSNRERESLVKQHISSLEREIYLKNQQRTLIEEQDRLLLQKEDIKELEKTINDALLFETAFNLWKSLNNLEKQQEQLSKFIEDTQQTILKFQKQIDILSEQFRVSQQKYQKLPTIKEELTRVQHLINKHQELLKLQKRRSENEATINELATMLRTKNQQLIVLKQQQAEYQVVSERIMALNLIKNEDLLLVEQLKLQQQQFQQQIDCLNEIKEIDQEIKGIQETLRTANQQKSLLELSLKEYEALRQQNIAASLATTLKENQPCPVCGSLHHPFVASQIEIEVDNNSLNHQLQAVLRLIIESETKRSSLSQRKEKLQKNVMEKNVDALLKRNQQQMEKTNLKLSEVNSALEELKQKGVENNQSVIDLLSSEIHQSTGSLTTLRLDQENIQKEINEVEELTRDSKLESLESQELSLRTQIDHIEQEFVALSQELNERRQEFTRHETTLKGYRIQLETVNTSYNEKHTIYEDYLVDNEIDTNYQELMVEKTVLEAYQKTVAQYQQQVFSVKEALKKNQQELSSCVFNDNPDELLITKQKELQGINEEYATTMHIYLNHQKNWMSLMEVQQSQQTLIDQAKMISLLSDIANGSAYSGNVSFERYVLSMYFDEVLKLANLRLLEMTQSRYELVRQEENRNNRGAKGLELDVMDFYSSQMRSVKTLSGGETFKASLSLALGLSDFIKTIKGGTSIDALFVDEGFGSLDSTSLDSAIDVLLQLNESGRLVGIISHVSELKQRITAQIVVEKTVDGSKVSVYA